MDNTDRNFARLNQIAWQLLREQHALPRDRRRKYNYEKPTPALAAKIAKFMRMCDRWLGAHPIRNEDGGFWGHAVWWPGVWAGRSPWQVMRSKRRG